MRRTVAHVFVEDLGRPVIDDRDVHHLSRVLRLRPGEAVGASDGRGGSRPCLWAGTAELDPAGDASWEDRAVPEITVAFAITKGDHPEWAVQRLTEAGADRVVLMGTERCVARWAQASQARQLERLREIARQASMQARRVWLPVLRGPVAFSEVARLVAAGAPGASDGVDGMALAVPGGAPITLATPTVLIGPEGGWADTELAAVPHHVSLGPHVLRAETAAMAAGVLLAALRARSVATLPL